MRQVTGFQAKDGTFFETREECRYHEAEIELTAALSMMHVDAMKFFAIIENHPVLIEEYVHARKAYRETTRQAQIGVGQEDTDYSASAYSEDVGSESARREYPFTGTYSGDGVEGEREASPVFSLKADGREPMSAVGSGTQSEAVRDEREGDGLGGRRDDA